MKYEFIEYLQQHKQDTLAVTTILNTHGSTPRKAGTTMIVHPDGSIFGTIGGGRAGRCFTEERSISSYLCGLKR